LFGIFTLAESVFERVFEGRGVFGFKVVT